MLLSTRKSQRTENIANIKNNCYFWERKLVESGINCGGQFIKRSEESVAQEFLELSPAPLDRIEFRRIRRERYEIEVVTSR